MKVWVLEEAERWKAIQLFFKNHFEIEEGEEVDVDTMLFLIGVQEVGKGAMRYKKDDKVNLIHVAVCRLLTPYGYYEFVGKDDDFWPVYELKESLPNLKPNEQKLLMKKAILNYFEEEELL